jgi:t-SNARE complex subunit (syntaxin)
MADTSIWGSVVGGVTDLVGEFNYKGQENEIALAQANAEIARANAESSPENTKKNIIWIVVVIAVVVIVLIMMSRKSD